MSDIHCGAMGVVPAADTGVALLGAIRAGSAICYPGSTIRSI